MQNSFFQAICRAGIFMICAQAIVHFRPQEAYEKYLKLLVSFMVLIQLLLPLGSFLLGGGNRETAELLEEFRRELEQGMEEARESAAEADAILGQMTLEEVRKRLEEGTETVDPDAGTAEDSGRGNTDRDASGNIVPNGESRESENFDIEIKIEIEPVEPIFTGD